MRTVHERPLSFAEAYATLSRAQKSGRGAPAYSRWVNRPLGRVLAAGAYRWGLTPNAVTAASAVFTYSGIAVVAIVAPSRAAALVTAGLLLVGFALDSSDGQLARLTGMGRPSGEWLDHVIDMGKVCLLHGAVAISWIRGGIFDGFQGASGFAFLPLGYLTVTVVGFFAWVLAESLVRIQHAARPAPNAASLLREDPRAAPPLRSWLLIPRDYGTLAVTFAWFGTPAFALTYTLLFLANAFILAASLPRWYRQVRAAEGAAP